MTDEEIKQDIETKKDIETMYVLLLKHCSNEKTAQYVSFEQHQCQVKIKGMIGGSEKAEAIARWFFQLSVFTGTLCWFNSFRREKMENRKIIT